MIFIVVVLFYVAFVFWSNLIGAIEFIRVECLYHVEIQEYFLLLLHEVDFQYSVPSGTSTFSFLLVTL